MNNTNKPMATRVVRGETASMAPSLTNPTEHLNDIEQIASRVKHTASMKPSADSKGPGVDSDDLRSEKIKRERLRELNESTLSRIDAFEKAIVSTDYDEKDNWIAKLKTGGHLKLNPNTGVATIAEASVNDIVNGLLTVAIKQGYEDVTITASSQEVREAVSEAFSDAGIKVTFKDHMQELEQNLDGIPEPDKPQKDAPYEKITAIREDFTP